MRVLKSVVRNKKELLKKAIVFNKDKNKGFVMLGTMIAMATVVPLGIYATVKVLEGTYKARESSDISLNRSLTLTYAENLKKEFNTIIEQIDRSIGTSGLKPISQVLNKSYLDAYNREYYIRKTAEESPDRTKTIYKYELVSAGRNGNVEPLNRRHNSDDVSFPIGTYTVVNGGGDPILPEGYGVFRININSIYGDSANSIVNISLSNFEYLGGDPRTLNNYVEFPINRPFMLYINHYTGKIFGVVPEEECDICQSYNVDDGPDYPCNCRIVYKHKPFPVLLEDGKYYATMGMEVVQNRGTANPTLVPIGVNKYTSNLSSLFYAMYDGITPSPINNKPILALDKLNSNPQKPFAYAFPLGETITFDFYKKYRIGYYKCISGKAGDRWDGGCIYRRVNPPTYLEVKRVTTNSRGCSCRPNSTVCSVTMDSIIKRCSFTIYLGFRQ